VIGSEEGAVIRRARAEDVETILDLLAFYERPRSYFEPFYLSDPSYRPDQSWLVEQDGRLLAHLRVFDRSIRVGGARLRVAALGNLITAPYQRGRGHAGRLLEAILAETPDEGFAYSLLRAYQPTLYERYGWVSIEEELVRAELPSFDPGSVAITPFSGEDLPEVMDLYEETNAGRTGPTIRSPEYWRGQLEWLEEDRDGFLIARRGGGTLAGYVRSRAGQHAVEILELGLEAGDVDAGRALLSAATRRHGRLQGRLPPSLRIVFLHDETEKTRANSG
jgi:N-acetylglutamate synthase-like GNAT family acetyltransferase